MRRTRFPYLLSLLALVAAPLGAAEKPAPAILLPAGTVLADGHALGGDTLIQPIPGQAWVRYDDDQQELWSVEVSDGEIRVFRASGALVARAEYVARERDGKPACFVYQMHIAPEWLSLRTGPEAATGKPDYGSVDDRIYSFREETCP